jgi:hypothetical protein
MIKIIKKIEHIFVSESDRWIYIERKGTNIKGLNYMQGDDYDEFLKSWNKPNEALTEFFYTQNNLAYYNKNIYKEIDDIIWTYVDAIRFYEEFG